MKIFSYIVDITVPIANTGSWVKSDLTDDPNYSNYWLMLLAVFSSDNHNVTTIIVVHK